MSFETALQQWRLGQQFADDAPHGQQPAIQRVEAEIVAELRRRLGGAFTVDELTALYEAGTSWCLDCATRIAPKAPFAWDARVADAAFARYVREAVDFAGGRRLEARP